MKKDLIGEIASRANSVDYWATHYYLPNPDPVLKKMGRDVSVYRELLADGHLMGCVRRRKAAVKGLEWRLTPTGNKALDERLEQCFAQLPLTEIIGQILDASLFGYQVLEVEWENAGVGYLPKAIVAKPQEWFIFNSENQLRLLTKKSAILGEEMPPYRMLLATQNASYTNPYGQGDLSLCFWASMFKKGGFKFWLEFTEKYGSPWLVGKHPRSASTADKEALADSLEAMIGTAIAVVPDDASVKIEEAAGKSSSADNYERFLQYCKAEIAIAILGQNQTTEAEANRASATAGLQVTEEIRNDDVAMVERVFNQLLQWIMEINSLTEEQPQFELFEQESIDILQVERDEKLANLGVQFSEQYLKRTYNFEEGDITVQAVENRKQSANSAEFAEGKERRVKLPMPAPILEQVIDEGETQVDGWLQSIKDQLSQADSLEDFRNQLDSLIPELNFAEYGELLAWGSTIAELAGRQSVNDERSKKAPLS